MRKIILLQTFCLFTLSVFSQGGYVQEGKAAFYADKFEGRVTASGERYSHNKSTCAHLSLPFGTILRVTNLANNLSIVVRVNDRGPFVPNRIIDLSRSAAEKLGFIEQGLADVRIEVVSDDTSLTQPIAVTPKIEEKQPIAEEKPIPQQTPVVEAKPESTPPKIEPEKSIPIETPSFTTPISSDYELYEIKVTKQKPGGFTVQIGSYKELVNLLRIADDLKGALKKEVRVQVATINNEKVYRLMVGEFSTRAEADKFKSEVAKIYNDCFVLELK